MLLIPIMVVLISYVAIDAEKSKLESSLSRMEQDYIETLKSTTRSKVNNIVDLASYRKSVIKVELHSRIHQRVEDAYQIATKLQTYYAPTKSEQEIKTLIIEALRPLTWNNGESFIWILDFDGVFQLAPEYLRNLEGQSIIDFKDATGREVIKEEIAITRSKGEGFLWDTFTKPNSGSDEQFEQLAFVRSLGFYNWYIGSAEYLDTATKFSDRHLLAEIGNLGGGGSNYFFILDMKGELLLNSVRPELVGLNYKETESTELKKLYRTMMESANNASNTEFIEYQWLNPKTEKIERKLSYVQAVPGSDWVIGSGFYTEDVTRELQPKIAQNARLNQHKLDELLNMAFWSFVGSIVISLLLSLAVYRLLWRYREEVVEKNRALIDLNNQLEARVLKRTQALEEINAELEMLAHTDCLTGIHNRFSFMKIVEIEKRRANRFNDVFSVVLFDVDNFKKINDQYGHDVGDSVLKELVRVIEHSLREVDSLCRFGGEEFIVLLPRTELSVALNMAERMCLEVANHTFDVVGQVTISAGVGEYRSDINIDGLIKSVDLALYQAKNSGKNRVCAVEEPLQGK